MPISKVPYKHLNVLTNKKRRNKSVHKIMSA